MKTHGQLPIHRKGISALAVALAGLLFTGCSSLQPPFDADGIPAARYRVGGGFDIDYHAPATGTAMVVEDSTHRIWATESVAEGDSFRFEIRADDSDLHERLGQNAGDARFSLYFVPAKAKQEDREKE